MDIKKVSEQKINETQVNQTKEAQNSSAIKNTKVNTQKAAETQTTKATKYLDKIDFSGDASVAAEGITAAKSAPDTRAEKVAHLKAAIKNGTYSPDSKNVADAMIQNSLEESLLTRKG